MDLCWQSNVSAFEYAFQFSSILCFADLVAHIYLIQVILWRESIDKMTCADQRKGHFRNFWTDDWENYPNLLAMT